MVNFYVLANEVSPPGTMGGNTKILLEFARRWAASGNNVNIITSALGYQMFQEYKIKANYFIIPVGKTGGLGLPVRNVVQTIKACINALKGYPPHEKTIIYSASNFWPDVVPAIIMKKKIPSSKWVGTCYLPIPNPFKGFEFAYEQKVKLTPEFKALANYIIEKPSTSLIKRSADFIFVTNDADKKYFTDMGVPLNKLRAIYGGVDLDTISKVPSQKIVYDGCFVGRLHPQKGLIYLIRIWGNVCEKMPSAKLAIIGNGSPDYEQQVKNEVKKLGLEKNITFLGFVDGVEKYKILKSIEFFYTRLYMITAAWRLPREWHVDCPL